MADIAGPKETGAGGQRELGTRIGAVVETPILVAVQTPVVPTDTGQGEAALHVVAPVPVQLVVEESAPVGPVATSILVPHVEPEVAGDARLQHQILGVIDPQLVVI